MMNYYIKTQRLTLRKFNLNDVQKVFEFSREESLKKWIPNQCYSDINEAAGIVKLIIGNYMKSELPVVLAVEKSDTAELIGHVGLSGIDEGVEIGYAIGQQYQKSGYASEAVGAFCDWCRSEFKYDKIWGIVKKGNTASCRVLEKTGFTKTGNESTVRDVYVKELKRLEQMSDFFTARVDGYDTHMLNDVKGCKDGYIKMAELVPLHTKTILDLGCGTGLELDEIFKRFPDISVLGIDLTQAMLDKLIQKHSDKNIKLVIHVAAAHVVGRFAAGPRRSLERILADVGLTDRRRHTPRELSGGQQQRVAIARALVNEPDIILADEPIGNLDSKTGADIMKLLKQINRDYGKTIVQVTHSQEAAEYGERIVHVRDGKVWDVNAKAI
jgi:RimJ/RimL family protein N-acetyltransferase